MLGASFHFEKATGDVQGLQDLMNVTPPNEHRMLLREFCYLFRVDDGEENRHAFCCDESGCYTKENGKVDHEGLINALSALNKKVLERGAVVDVEGKIGILLIHLIRRQAMRILTIGKQWKRWICS
jgi:hypothetical protein